MKDLMDYFNESIFYPGTLILNEGLKENILYEYVSSDFINVLVNFKDKITACAMIDRYSEESDDDDISWEEKCSNVDKVLESEYHSNFQGCNFNDIILLTEVDKYYVFYYSDRDVSDCMVGKISKENIESEKEIIDAFYNFASKDGKRKYKRIEPEKLTGWLTI